MRLSGCKQCETLWGDYRTSIMELVLSANRYAVAVVCNGAGSRAELSLKFKKADWLREQAREQLFLHESSHANEMSIEKSFAISA